MELKGATAIVTGGASGLGEACVRRFVASGANVVIADLNEERGQAVATELGAAVRFVKTDVSNEDDPEKCLQTALEAFGGVHILVNCAGIATAQRTVGREGPMPLNDFTKVIKVNLIGSFNMIRVIGAKMMEQEPNANGERGVIINTASVAAYDGQIGQVPYSASKGGIVGMTLPLAREFSKFGIRVCTIAPGIMDTPMMQGLPEAARISLGQQVPFPPRLGRPEEYAHLANFIIDNELINGEVIRLDGAIRMAPK
ncbi:MAG: 3-hydroxyacyl-CoA dehydrogenase [Anaerolineales bacterium]|nr:3-hydroxyacyl-CoA dehydrogenase [Anaerolineales bacterium]